MKDKNLLRRKKNHPTSNEAGQIPHETAQDRELLKV